MRPEKKKEDFFTASAPTGLSDFYFSLASFLFLFPNASSHENDDDEGTGL